MNIWLHFSFQLTAHEFPKGWGREEEENKAKEERTKKKRADRTYLKGKIDWSALLK